MKSPAKGTLVLVKWRDSARMPAGWTYESDVPKFRNPDAGESVGWLYSEPGEDVVLIPHRQVLPGNADRQVMGGLSIPKECVTSIKRLKG